MNSELTVVKNTLTRDTQTENVAIARRIYILIKETYDYKIEILVRKNMRLKKKNIYIIRLKEKVIELLSQLDLKTSDEYITQTIKPTRAKEHTTELQSRDHLVCRLLLKKK